MCFACYIAASHQIGPLEAMVIMHDRGYDKDILHVWACAYKGLDDSDACELVEGKVQSPAIELSSPGDSFSGLPDAERQDLLELFYKTMLSSPFEISVRTNMVFSYMLAVAQLFYALGCKSSIPDGFVEFVITRKLLEDLCDHGGQLR